MTFQKLTIAQLQQMRESEDHVEFKECLNGKMSFNGADKSKPVDRRKCILGYTVALSNAGGGFLVLGMNDDFPHKVVGTSQCKEALGELENRIYKSLNIPVNAYELFDENHRRVVVIDIPCHPIGKVLKFEDVALWRSGEDLVPMPDIVYLSIIQELELDFSEKICPGIALSDLDRTAIKILKEKFSAKQKNAEFISLPDLQALRDLKLMRGNKVTNAAVLLVGKEDVIQSLFPQAKVMHEYRNTESQERFDKRVTFGGPFYILIEKLWDYINSRNGSVPLQEGPYIFDIPFFNEEVIRELINNAFVHRDYRMNSEIVIKQYPTKLSIINPGGFPIGVSLDNLLTVSSTPRNRLLADVLAKTGIVERSGQGIDIIFARTLSEGKQKPDYSKTDDYQVTAILSAVVKDSGFALFIKSVQSELSDNQRLSVFDILTFCEIRDGEQPKDKDMAKKLFAFGFLEKRGKTNAIRYILPRRYYELNNSLSEYSLLTDWDDSQVWAVLYPYLCKYRIAKKSDIARIVGNHVSETQLRRIIERLSSRNGPLVKTGKTTNTVYSIAPAYQNQIDILNKATQIGLSQIIHDSDNKNNRNDGINDGKGDRQKCQNGKKN